MKLAKINIGDVLSDSTIIVLKHPDFKSVRNIDIRFCCLLQIKFGIESILSDSTNKILNYKH